MIRLVIFFISLCLLVGSINAESSTTIDASSAGSITYSHCVSLETAGEGLKWPVFGGNQTSYTYDGSQASVVSMGRTTIQREVVIDQTSSNYIAGLTTVTGDYMINAEDTAGMINIQPNIPENMCDQASLGLIGSDGSSSSYPYSESFEGKTGVILHAGGAYQSMVGLNDGDVTLSGAADIPEKGYLYQSKIVTSKKGFDKNATTLNLDTSETMNAIVRSAIKSDETEVHAKVVSKYTSVANAFDSVIEAEATNQSVTTISAERVNETSEESIIEFEEPVNLTANQTHGESKGLEEISGQSIIRD